MIAKTERLWCAVSVRHGDRPLIFRARTFRRGLLAKLGRRHAEKIYQDPDARHVGYIVAGDWWEGYELTPMGLA